MTLPSVFLDARTAGAQLPHNLLSLGQAARQWQGGYELLLVDDTGDRRLPDLARRHQAILLPCSAPTLGRRLNAAVGASHGEVLMFPGLGACHAIDWLSQRMAEFELGRKWDAAVSPLYRQRRTRRWWSWLHKTSPRDTFWVAREWFERIGGFDPQLGCDALPDLLERLRACQARVVFHGG
ncbi:hypothetical protein ACOJCM_06975 [Billgrantia sp. LNSP4103-1]|uniref:hypothetical protein n=1 Tax=Billgrantia sp. LNSP4103-1 TaxID=3410266 RepID=UPI00403F1F16